MDFHIFICSYNIVSIEIVLVPFGVSGGNPNGTEKKMTLGFIIDSFGIISWTNNKEFF